MKAAPSKRATIMRRPVANSATPKRKWIRLSSWLLFVAGVISLGYVGFSLIDAELYQAYASWRLDEAVADRGPASSPGDSGPLAAAAPGLRSMLGAPLVPAGSALGRIEVARLGITVMMLAGVDRKTLRRGVGHIPGTALPGYQGNVGLAGHRDTFFRGLRDVRVQDEIILTTPAGIYRYRVAATSIVPPADITVLRDDGASVLTLFTCYPFDFIGPAPDRFIVRAALVTD